MRHGCTDQRGDHSARGRRAGCPLGGGPLLCFLTGAPWRLLGVSGAGAPRRALGVCAQRPFDHAPPSFACCLDPPTPLLRPSSSCTAGRPRGGATLRPGRPGGCRARSAGQSLQLDGARQRGGAGGVCAGGAGGTGGTRGGQSWRGNRRCDARRWPYTQGGLVCFLPACVIAILAVLHRFMLIYCDFEVTINSDKECATGWSAGWGMQAPRCKAATMFFNGRPSHSLSLRISRGSTGPTAAGVYIRLLRRCNCTHPARSSCPASRRPRIG